jgi:hypothetical protein
MKTRTVKVHDPGTVSAWTSWWELYHYDQLVQYVDFGEHSIRYHWMDLWAMEEPAESGDEVVVAFTQATFVANVYADATNKELIQELFTAYVIEPSEPTDDTIDTGTNCT